VTCRAARRLLPLFVGGDLEAAKMRALADHVGACAACRAETDEYGAAFSLLSLPSFSFSESERTLLRRRVLDEIARRRESPSPFAAFLLRPRFALGVLAGLVALGASLFAPFLVQNGGERAAILPDRPAPSATPVPAAEHIAERIAETAPPPPDRSTAIPRVPQARREPRPPAPASEKSGPAMRFEIQTGNVNVRIIWFAGGTSDGEPPSGPAGDPNGVS
jgi:Putative zinc-finger